MRKLLFIALLFMGCESNVIEQEPEPNTVFWTPAIRQNIHITGITSFVVWKNSNIGAPDCETQLYDSCGYEIFYLKPGEYSVRISTQTYSHIFDFTIHDDRCNIFNCAMANGWE